MRLSPVLATALLAAAALTASVAVLADDDKGSTTKPTPRLDVARGVVKSLAQARQDLNKVLATVQTAGSTTPEGLGEALGKVTDDLESTLVEARKLTRPIKLADLTKAERKSLTAAVEKARDDKGDENPLSSWQERAMTRALEDADLDQDQEEAARSVIGAWFKKALEARSSGDSKLSSDLKRQRNKDLTKALGKKKARKVINYLDRMSNRWR